MGLLSVGGKLANKVVDACTTSSSSTTAATSFDSVLGTEVTNANNKFAAMDSTQLASQIEKIGKNLAEDPDVKAFIGNDKSFKVSSQNGGYVITRADGSTWRIPNDSATAKLASDYCQANLTQVRNNGSTATGTRSAWTVLTEEAEMVA